MKTNSYLLLILLSSLAALAFGASGVGALLVSVTAAILGVAFNDYTRQPASAKLRPMA